MEDISKSSYDPKEFYADSAKYWNNVPATLNGMLGGFGFISRIDIDGSDGFLNSLFEVWNNDAEFINILNKQCFQLENPPNKNYALDCGSGIGRITKKLLIKHFKLVDLVEQNSKFLDTAKKLLQSSNVGEFYSLGSRYSYLKIKIYYLIFKET